MNVLIIIGSNNVGGVEKRFLNLYNHIRSNEKSTNNNFSYTFLFHNRVLSRTQFDKVNSENPSHLTLATYGFTEKILSNSIDRKISQFLLAFRVLILRFSFNFDTVHFVTSFATHFKFLFGQKKRVSSFYNGGSTKVGVESKLFKRIVSSRDILVDCLSADIKKEIIKKYPSSANRLFVSPCSFIDYSDTDFQLNLKENIIVFSGRFNEQKGVRLLIDFIPLFIKNIPNYRLHIMGYGPLEDDIKDAIKKFDSDNRISIGFSSNTKEQLRKSRIFLSLQRNENYPSQSLIEAMACGNIPVATDNGLTHLLVNEETGVRVSENDPIELLKEVKGIIGESEKLGSLPFKNREFVLENHSPNRFLTYLKKLYLIK